MYSALPTAYGKKLPVLSLLFTFLMIGWVSVGWGQIAAWNFSTVTSASPPATFSATTYNTNLVNTANNNLLTRGAGASASAANNSFRTTGFQNDGISVSNTDYFQITLTSKTGYTLSLSSIDAKFNGTQTYYASLGVTSQFAYSTDGTTFTLIGSPVTSTSLTLSTFNLSSIPALQNITAGTTVTLRYYASGQTNTGGWGFYSNSSNNVDNGLSISGTLTALSAIPVVTSATVPGVYGTSLNYQISATGSPTAYGIANGSSLPAGLTLNTSTGVISGTPTVVVSNYQTIVTASNSNGTGNGTLTFNISQAPLTISGLTASNKVYDGTTAATLSGTASLNGVVVGDNVSLSGTPVGTFADANVGTNKTVTVSGYALSGSASSNYSLTQPTLTASITKANQTITFNTIPAKTAADADFDPGATASSGLAVTYTSSNTAVATMVSNQVHIVGAGTSVITALQAGNNNYNAASSVSQTLTVTAVSVVIAKWTFESGTTVSGTTTLNVLPALADVGMQTTNSSISGTHANTNASWNLGIGNGSSGSVNSTTWAVNDYYLFKIDKSNYNNITCSFDQTGSNTGPRDFKLQYSLDGTSFIDFTNNTYSITNDSWSGSGNPKASSKYSFDLSNISSLSSSSILYFKIVDVSNTSIVGGIVATAGTNRIDNFSIVGYANNTQTTADYRTKQSGNFSAASTWEYNSFGTTYVDATAPPTATNNITVQSTHTLTADQNITIGAGKTLTVSGTVTPLAIIAISGAGTLTGSGNTGSVQVTAAGNTSGDFAAQYTIANKVLTNLEVDFAGNSGQYIDGISYGPLKFSNNTGVLLAGDVTVSNTLRRNAGALSLRSKKLTLVGNISNGNGNINAGTGEIVFGGTSAQTIPSDLFTGSVANLTINNNSGVVETSGTSLITGSLTLNAGTLSIGSSNLTITAALSRTNGNLDASAGTLIFTNGIAISIPGSTFTGPVQNLTINSSSSVALNSSLTINGALTLTSGSLDINDQTLTLIGSVVNSSGDLKGSNKSGLVLSGLTPVTLNFNNSFNVLRNLTISTGANVTLGSALRITSDTSLGSAGIVLVSGNLNTGSYKLTLKSSTSGTASVGTSTGTITGDITVERQIPDNGHREWRLLTAPVTGTTIKASWQENANPGGTNNPNPGFGTLITGPGQGSSATAAANGYDFWPAIANSSSSIRQYAGTPTSGSWVSIPSIKNLDISTYPAYLLFVRGDRSIYAAGTNTNATILQATGTLKQGTQSFTLYGSSVQGYTLVGNPYACAIDFDKILIRNATNLLPQFWRWDAQSGSYGGYTLVKKSGTTYYTVPSPFTGNGTATATQQYIESGQGFFVQPASGITNNASFDIQETDKVTNTTTTSPFRIKPPVEARLFINLNQYYSADSIVLSDGVLASFVNTADTTQNVAKPFNFNENLGISRGTSVLTVEAHKPITSTDTIRLTLWNTTQRNYQLQLKADNWKTAVHAYLLDNYLKTSTPVNLKGNITTLNFAVDGTAASAAQDRFMVVFNTTAAAPLLARKLQTGDADVENGKSLVTVYPNPVGKDRIIHLQLANFATGNYHCSLYDNNGKPVLQTTIAVTGSSSAHIHIPQAAAQGLYYLKIADANGKIIRQVAVTVIY